MRKAIAANAGTSNNLSPEITELAIEVSNSIDKLDLQIKRCAVWIESGRIIEAAALSEDCENLIILSDKLNIADALPEWINFCTEHNLDTPLPIDSESINTINRAITWEGKLEQLTGAWIEANILQSPPIERWGYIIKLAKLDEDNLIWQKQAKMLAKEVFPLFVAAFDTAFQKHDIAKMKVAYKSIQKLV